MDRVTNEIRRYQQGIDQSVDLILRKVKQDVRNQIQSLSSTWSAQIDQQGGEISQSEITRRVSSLIHDSLDKNMNKHIGQVIKNYKQQQLDRVDMNISIGTIRKKRGLLKRHMKKSIMLNAILRAL